MFSRTRPRKSLRLTVATGDQKHHLTSGFDNQKVYLQSVITTNVVLPTTFPTPHFWNFIIKKMSPWFDMMLIVTHFNLVVAFLSFWRRGQASLSTSTNLTPTSKTTRPTAWLFSPTVVARMNSFLPYAVHLLWRTVVIRGCPRLSSI